jgi:hypothetical protein
MPACPHHRLGLFFRRILTILHSVVLLLGVSQHAALAETLQAPAGGLSVAIPNGHVACAPPQGAWTLDANGTAVRPPSVALPGEQSTIRIAAAANECGGKSEVLSLQTLADFPEIDAASVVWSIATARLEFSGKNLSGLRVRWGSPERHKTDVCVPAVADPSATGVAARERCVISIGQADVESVRERFTWVPQGGYFGREYLTYNAQGVLVPPEGRELNPQRVIVDQVLEKGNSVDVSRGKGRINLLYDDAVENVDCEGAQCELEGDHILVRAVPAATKRIVVRLKLRSRVWLWNGQQTLDAATETFEVVRCDMAIVSGSTFRDVDNVRLLARLPTSCSVDVERLNWTVNDVDAAVEKVALEGDSVYALLVVNRIVDNRAVVVASRPQDQSVLAFTATPAVRLEAVHTSLVLAGFGEIDFIPKNRAVHVTTSAVAGGRWVPIDVPGAYTVEYDADGASVRGVYMSSGYTALRLGFRVDGIPVVFRDVSFITLTDSIQRPIREANLPISLGSSGLKENPVVELACAVDEGVVRRIGPGTTQHIPFDQRNSCRLLIHRSRIPKDAGEQLVELEVSVTAVGDAERNEARLSERLLLRHSDETEVVWIQGAKQQFDRINVRVHHVVEEARYLLGSQYRLPVGQWTIVTEDARLKFYATATIPSGLFRFSSDPQELGSGALALNFGVLARLTLLSDDGKESLVGLETGMMGMGLASEKARELAIVSGIGVGVPLGNVNQPTQASLNIHAWISYSLGKREGQLVNSDGSTTNIELTPWAFIFGPSITIGSLAAFL